MLTLIAEDFIEPKDIDKVLPLYRELIEKTREEKGCLSYDLHHDLKEPGHFVFIEEWVDEAAVDFHVETPHFKRLVPLIDAYQIKNNRYTRLAHIDEVFK